MALINRVARLFRADFNAVLDRIEEPAELLRQAIRDMEDELAAAEQRIQARAHDQDALDQRRSELVAKLGEIEEELDLCFAQNKESLARSLVRRKLEAERLVKRLDSKLTANGRALELQQARVEENRATLEGLQQKAEVFAQREPSESGAGSEFDDLAWMARELSVTDDEIDVAFLREQQARSAS